ncbi:MAG: hypothetical protein R3E39_00830 [Anaerolineae bacterium]
MSNQNAAQETVFACDMYALTPEQREHHGSASKELFADVSKVRETPDGYAFRLPAKSSTLVRVADFITYERLCCPFFAFNVEVEPRGGAIWIGLSGTEGAKAFIVAALGWLLKDDVAIAAAFKPVAT